MNLIYSNWNYLNKIVFFVASSLSVSLDKRFEVDGIMGFKKETSLTSKFDLDVSVEQNSFKLNLPQVKKIQLVKIE